MDLSSFQYLRDSISIRQKTGRLIPTASGKRIPEIRIRYMIDKRGEFPTGLLYAVENFLKQRGLKYVLNDLRVHPMLYKFSTETVPANYSFEPYPEQIEAAKAAKFHGRGIIVGPTGVGKSAIVSIICDTFRVPTLVVVPTLELKAQLTTCLSSVFGEEHVGPLKGSSRPSQFISVENVDALDPRKPLKGFDLVIIDEFHHSGARTYRTLNKKAWSEIYFKIGLTATPFRSNDDERLLLESVLSQVIYRIEYNTAVEKGYIVPMEAYYYDLPKMKLQHGQSNFHSAYSQLVVKREDRNQLIAQLTGILRGQQQSVLVLAKQIDHGLQIQREIEDQFALTVPFVKGENDDNRETITEFSSGRDYALIGTTGVVGEGVDTKAAEWVVLAGGGKSKNAFMQQVGRVFRTFPGKESGKVIMFRDASNKWLLDHFNSCVRYLREEYGIEPVKLDLPDAYNQKK
jgi:superfamily II DNA or RNA helicase